MQNKTKFEKPYKEALPKNTILKIQNILNEINLFATPVSWNNPYNNIYSVRVEALEEYGGFGTNGKGTNQIYALASAYAEFIERLQNLYISGAAGFTKIFLDYIKRESDVFFFPDEKFLLKNEFLNLPENILSDFFSNQNFDQIKTSINLIYKKLNNENRKGLLSVPFYDFNNNKLTHIPHNFLLGVTGSNGMAAGNTIAEATFQALCEIYERNAAAIVYYNRLTPPSIPLDYLKKYTAEYKIIQEIESQGYTIDVRDFSCNLKIPVVGLIIIDKSEKKYRLNIGSDTNFQIALNRTLTEIFQGLNQDVLKDFFLDFPNINNTPYFFKKSNKKGQKDEEKNFKKYIKNSGGIFPPSIFAKKVSYEFDESIFKPSNSYEKGVKNLLALAKNLKYEVYLRDVSFLNFPTVYIYIPNISILGNKQFRDNIDDNSENLTIFDDLEKLILPFNKFIYDNKKIKKVITILKKTGSLESSSSEYKAKYLFRLEFKNDTIWNNLPVGFFVVLLFFLIKDYVNSVKYLNQFIKHNNLHQVDYYKEVLKYFNALKTKTSTVDISQNILDNFKTPETLFSHIQYPNCPNCNDCNLSDDCRTKINIENTILINKKFKESVVNQYKFEIFS